MGLCSAGSSQVIIIQRLFPVKIMMLMMENTPNSNPWRFGRSENPRRTNFITVDMLSSASISSYFICENDSI